MGRRSIAAVASLLLVLTVLSACASPVSVARVDTQRMQRSLNRSALTSDRLSETSQIALNRRGLLSMFNRDPAAAIESLQGLVRSGHANRIDLFALAETSYLLARRSDDRARFLASAVYAFAYLFPKQGAALPSAFDPTFRQAADLYNRALTRAFVTAKGARLELRPGRYALPFGTLDLSLDKDSLRWGNAVLVDLAPAADLHVRGAENTYRLPGLGAPVAAGTETPNEARGFQVTPHVRVPATVLMVIPNARAAIAAGDVHAALSVETFFHSRTTVIDGHTVPLEFRLTASLALALQQSNVWARELRGLLFGNLLNSLPGQLVALEPNRTGRIPVVLVHGTASSVGRWFDMVNDLLSDPEIDDHYEFWLFSYTTGAPIPYSALLLRRALKEAYARLGGLASDPALGQTVLIGHSQGGLVAKMLVIDPGSRLWDGISREPFDELKMSQRSKDLLHAALFVHPVPEVRRVVFIATPHQGSHAAAIPIVQFLTRLITLPVGVMVVARDLATDNKDELVFNLRRNLLGGSIYGMRPGSSFIRTLSNIPVVPQVATNSIIPTLGDGPLEQRTDGVVSYASASIKPVESELVVKSGHSTQSTPATIAEVRRILLHHLVVACKVIHRDTCGPAAQPSGRTEATHVARNRAAAIALTP